MKVNILILPIGSNSSSNSSNLLFASEFDMRSVEMGKFTKLSLLNCILNNAISYIVLTVNLVLFDK